MFDPELESFKTLIDLRAYASSLGYQLDRKESWGGSAVMRNESTADKIIIKRGSDGHHLYFSVHRDNDSGSIIDFVQKRLGLGLCAVREELRPWIGSPPQPVPTYAPLIRTPRDRVKVEAEFTKMQDALRHPYLEDQRALPASLLAEERFKGCIRIDKRGNAVFPHFDAEGICGFEIKNAGFTGFSTGGTKGLWLTRENAQDRRIILAESAIDALSHAVLFPDPFARYGSIGGKPNPIQPELVRAAIARMPENAAVISAMDADAEGGKLALMVKKAVELSGRDDLRFLLQEPSGFKDWNDQLRGVRNAVQPVRQDAGLNL